MPPITEHSFFELFFLKFQREKGHRGKATIIKKIKLIVFFVSDISVFVLERNRMHSLHIAGCTSVVSWLPWS